MLVRILRKLLPVSAICFALLGVNTAWGAGSAPLEAPLPQADQETLFNQAVAVYQQNQFTPALDKFQQVSGPHAQEAKQYIAKIKAYKEAMSAAKSILDRNADERDARSLAYAIDELQQAIKIKPDGPWQPMQQLEQARQQKAEIDKAHAASNQAADRGLCDKSLTAAEEHAYKEAAQISCLLADDSPAYSCGGNEAVYLCALYTEMAKMDKSSPGSHLPNDRGPVETVANSGNLDNGKAAFDRNDFARARALFQRVTGDAKPAADEFLNKISRYNDSFANGDKLSRDGKYDQARASFLSAASIKADGPGNPQGRASTMELFLGLDQFYSGDYVSATQHLDACLSAQTGKQALARFYLGASKLARFFVTGGEDSALHQDALNDLKLAKQAGFKTTGQDVSPKILQAYQDLSF